MRQSQYFLKTQKGVQINEEGVSSRLLKQGGFIKESVAGRYYFLPLGQRVQQKIMGIIKAELDMIGFQEMLAPTLHPLRLWQETNRDSSAGFELMKIKDRRGSEFALGGTAEEMFVDLVRQYKFSYRDLPILLYQFSTKFRDELRARGGLLRVREFIMKDGYSFHRDVSDFGEFYARMKLLYLEIFKKLGLDIDVVESDNGYIGGEYSHEFVVESDAGESKYFCSDGSPHSAHEDVARIDKGHMEQGEVKKPLNEVMVRGINEDDSMLQNYTTLPSWRRMKCKVLIDDMGLYYLTVIRGDLDFNLTKIKKLLKSGSIREISDSELHSIVGVSSEFISPVGVKNLFKSKEIRIIIDDSIPLATNMACYANNQDVLLFNVNFLDDYNTDVEGDIAMAKEGDISFDGIGKLIEKKGIEVGNIFQLGYHYSNLMQGSKFTDQDGKDKPYYMGCYGIGIGRTMAAIVEKHNDERGIIWPKSVAPFHIHLLALSGGTEVAEKLYQDLIKQGAEVLYDDRDKPAGEKFADADLIGLPLRIVLSKKTVGKGVVEIKNRQEENSSLISIDQVQNITNSP